MYSKNLTGSPEVHHESKTTQPGFLYITILLRRLIFLENSTECTVGDGAIERCTCRTIDAIVRCYTTSKVSEFSDQC